MRDQVFLQALERGIQACGIELPQALASSLLPRLLVQAQQLWRWSSRVRLVGDDGPESVALRHSLDSLLVAEALVEPDPGSLCTDLGSGAGFPGLVLAARWPQVRFQLIEADKRKASFLATCAGAMGLTLKVLPAHADGNAAEEGAELADLVISRAVRKLHQLLPWEACYAKPGGRVAAMIAGEGPDEPDETELIRLGEEAGLALSERWEGSLPEDLGKRSVVIWTK